MASASQSAYSDIRLPVKLSAGSHYINCQGLISACPIDCMVSSRIFSELKKKAGVIQIRKTQQKSDHFLYPTVGTEDEALLQIRY
jgi:hypothetical protein